MIARRLAVSAVLTLLVLGAPAAGVARAETSITCAATALPIDDAGVARVWAIAADRLAGLAGPATLPFGAAGRSPYVRTSAYAWTSGFYPASLWLAYAHTSDRAWLTRARAYTRTVLTVSSWRGSHDLGFMVGLPANLGLRLDPSAHRRDAYAAAIHSASLSLSKRWNAHVGALRSSYYNGHWGLIIDSAMNAPMLIEAGLAVGGATGQRLVARGRAHMLTLAANFVRPDGSTHHRLAFDPITGRLIGPIYGQGLSSASTWARGQAWAINGFAQAYRMTGDERLLTAARRTADYWLARVPAGCVPAWDLDVSDDAAPRDSSAAAIAADGLLILAPVDPDPARASSYRAHALATLGTLATVPWIRDNGRGILQRQAFNVPADAREGTYAWGDTYLLHALAQVVAYKGAA